jgi:hypothetical protein
MRMERVARNPEMVSYLQDWARHQLSRADFNDNLRLTGRVWAMEDPDGFAALGLDLQLLGIKPAYGRVDLYRDTGESLRAWQDREIVGIGVGEGRNAVVLDLRETFSARPEADLAQLVRGARQISEGVLLSCRH